MGLEDDCNLVLASVQSGFDDPPVPPPTPLPTVAEPASTRDNSDLRSTRTLTNSPQHAQDTGSHVRFQHRLQNEQLRQQRLENTQGITIDRQSLYISTLYCSNPP